MLKFEGYSPLYISRMDKAVGSLLTAFVVKKGSCPIYHGYTHLCNICFNITSIMITDICLDLSKLLSVTLAAKYAL